MPYACMIFFSCGKCSKKQPKTESNIDHSCPVCVCVSIFYLFYACIGLFRYLFYGTFLRFMKIKTEKTRELDLMLRCSCFFNAMKKENGMEIKIKLEKQEERMVTKIK